MSLKIEVDMCVKCLFVEVVNTQFKLNYFKLVHSTDGIDNAN